MRYYSGKLMLLQKEYGFEPFVAPVNFDRTAQEVDIYEKFKVLNSVDETASWIFSCTPAIQVVLPAVTNVSYVYAETINGVETVSNKIASGTVFTPGSSKRWVCGYYTGSGNIAVTLPNGSVWGYIYNLNINKLSSNQNSYIKYIYCNKLVSLTTLNAGAFYNCTSLSGKLTIPNTVMVILDSPYVEGGVFSKCSSLTSLTIPNSVTSIGGYAFCGCTGLTGSLTIPNSVTSIGTNCFVNILFSQISSSSLIYPVFDNVLYSLATANKVIAIYGAANYVGTITLRNDTTDISMSMAKKRTGTLTLPSSVNTIGSWAFEACPGITLVNSLCQIAPSLGTGTFNMGGSPRPLHIPVTNSGYNVAPWTTTTIFSSIIADL